MKSKRRHELEQNELADWLAATITGIKPYQNLILGVVLVLAIGSAVYAWWTRQSSTKNAEAWDEAYAAIDSQNLSKLGAVAEQYPNTSAAQWASLVAADRYLGSGCERLFSSKATGNDELHRAVQAYLTVLDQARDPGLRERATFGLARAHEALGELDAARKLYRQIGEDWPNGTYGAAAADRLADLEKPATKAMYDRFAKFDPKPAFLNEPGTPGQRPPFKVEDIPEEGPLFEPGKSFKLKPRAAEENQPEDVSATGKDLPKPPAEPATAPPGKEPDGSKSDSRAKPPEEPAGANK